MKSSERFLKESKVNIWLKEITPIVQPELQIVVLRVFCEQNTSYEISGRHSSENGAISWQLWRYTDYEILWKTLFSATPEDASCQKLGLYTFFFCQRGWHWKFAKWWLTVICKIWKLKENREKPQISRTTIKMQWLVKSNLGNVCGMDGGRKTLLERLNEPQSSWRSIPSSPWPMFLQWRVVREWVIA